MKRLMIVATLMLAQMGCTNPLGDGSASSKIESAFVPGLPSGTFVDHLVVLAGDQQSAPAGSTILISVGAVDITNRPVPGVPLTADVGSGGGTAAAVVTDARGLATLTWTLGPVAGTQTLTVRGGGASGTPQELTLTARALVGSASATLSSITGGGPVVADGVSASSVTITLRDAHANPIVGVTPTFVVSGNGNSLVPCTTTSSLGLSSCSLQSTVAEAKTLSILTPVALAGGAVTFVNGAADHLEYVTQPVGDVPPGQTFATAPTVRILDANGNVVTNGPDAGASLSLALTGGSGSLAGVVSRPAVAGVATFAGLSISVAGSGKILTATKGSTLGTGGTAALSVASASFSIHPPAPGSFALTAATSLSGGSISVAWGPASDAASYTLRFGTSSGSYPATTSSTATSPTLVSGLSDGTTYYFMITAVNVSGTSDASPERSAIADATAPSAPGVPGWAQNFSASTSSTPTLSWTAATDAGTGIARYEVALGSAVGATDLVTWTNVSLSTSFSFSGLSLANGNSYYAAVRAVDRAGNVSTAATSAALTIDTAPPAAPGVITLASGVTTTLTATPASAWTASSSSTLPDFAGYDIALGTSGGASDLLGWTGVGNVLIQPSLTGLALADGGVYYLSVRARKSTSLTSAVSTAAFAVVTATPTLHFDFTSGSWPLSLRFTRAGGGASAGTYFNAAGVMTTARANLALQSQNFAATWGLTNMTQLANAALAPDGTTTATKLVESNDAGVLKYHYVGQNISVSAGTTYCFSVFLKAAEHGIAQIQLGGTNFTNQYAQVNLASGTITGTGNGVIAASGILSVGNGWYRAHVCAQPTSSGNGAPLVLTSNGSATNFAGDGVSGIYAWGAQFEIGSTPSSYIYTTTTTAFGPRLDYEPATLGARGLLVEETRTNLIPSSAGLAGETPGGSGSTTYSVSTTLAPDQTTYLNKCTEGNASFGSVGQICRWLKSLTASTTYTASMYVKAAGRSAFTLLAFDNGQVSSASVDLAAGTSTMCGTTLGGSTGIQAVGGGLYRVWLTYTSTSAPSASYFDLRLNAGGCVGASYVGDGTSGLNVWGVQLEAGAGPTSYIPTNGSTATRNADIATVPALGAWFNAAAGTVVSRSSVLLPKTSYGFAFELGDGTFSNRLYTYYSGSQQQVQVLAGGTTLVSNFASATTASVATAASYQANAFACAINGAAAVTSSSGAVPTFSAFGVGRSPVAGAPLNGWVQLIDYYGSALSPMQLRYLSK